MSILSIKSTELQNHLALVASSVARMTAYEEYKIEMKAMKQLCKIGWVLTNDNNVSIYEAV